MNKSISALINEMQQIVQNQNGTLAGGYMSLTRVPVGTDGGNGKSTNADACNNHSCPNSTNGGRACTNHTSCEGSTNSGTGCMSVKNNSGGLSSY